MLSDYISKTAIMEIGSSVAEVFGVPLVITGVEGSVLFVSEKWPDRDNPGLGNYLNSLLRISDFGQKTTVKGPVNELMAVIPIRFEKLDCGYGLVNLTAAGITRDGDRFPLVEQLKKALGEVSIYATWAMRKEFNDIRADAVQTAIQFSSGQITWQQVIQSYLNILMRTNFFQLASVMTVKCTDGDGGFFPEYVSGDKVLMPECIEKCGLGWWAAQERKPVVVRNPVGDPRCQRGNPNCDVKTAAFWPLFVKDRNFGVLYLAGRIDKDIEPKLKDYITTVALNISLIMELGMREREHAACTRMINALNEISRVLNSSLDLQTTLNLIADMAANLFNKDVCCIYLKESGSPDYDLRVARGVNPGSVAQLCDRFRQTVKLEQTSTVEGLILEDFTVQCQEETVGYITVGGLTPGPLSRTDREIIKTFTHMVGIAVKNCRIYEETSNTLMETVTVLSLAIEARDKNIFGHSEHVRDLAAALARALEVPPREASEIETAGLLHDIGKLGIPETILNKTGALSNHEYEIFKRHPVRGAEILRSVTSLQSVAGIVRHHHEHFNGGGYPDGLRGNDIPLGARILTIANTFSSMISKRSYRLTKEPFEALEVIKENAGSQFDPELVYAFEKVIRQRYSLQFKVESLEGAAASPEHLPGAEEFGLTEREAEILVYIANGMSNREIAESLFLSEKTVKTHVTHILKKLKLTDRTKAAVFAIQKGISRQVTVAKQDG